MLDHLVTKGLGGARRVLVAGCGGGYDVLGAVPLLIATGTGSDLRRPLGMTIIGGLAAIDPEERYPSARAVAAGARELYPVADQPYGWRLGRVVDPFGHHWEIGRPLHEHQ